MLMVVGRQQGGPHEQIGRVAQLEKQLAAGTAAK
jgi:hypothetical protein